MGRRLNLCAYALSFLVLLESPSSNCFLVHPRLLTTPGVQTSFARPSAKWRKLAMMAKDWRDSVFNGAAQGFAASQQLDSRRPGFWPMIEKEEGKIKMCSRHRAKAESSLVGLELLVEDLDLEVSCVPPTMRCGHILLFGACASRDWFHYRCMKSQRLSVTPRQHWRRLSCCHPQDIPCPSLRRYVVIMFSFDKLLAVLLGRARQPEKCVPSLVHTHKKSLTGAMADASDGEKPF
jgi:hypothetical protein